MVRQIKLIRKWGVFLALNYVMLVAAGILLLNYIPRLLNRQGQELFFSLVITFQLSGIVFNNSINIYAVHRYFPDRLLGKGLKVGFVFSLIFDILAIITTIGVIITGLSDATIYLQENTGRAVFIFSCLLLFLIFTIYFIVLRIQMEGYLKRQNSLKEITEDLDKSLS